VETTERYIADADRQNILEPPTGDGYLCSDPISISVAYLYDSISTWYNSYNSDYKLREMILDRVTFKQGTTQCGRGLMTDPIAHVVTDLNADHE